MKKLKNTYWPFARAAVQGEFLAYPMETFLYMFGMTIGMFVVYYIWKVVYTSNDVLEGFTMLDMTGYIVMGFLSLRTLDGGTVWIIADEIRQGSIVMNLIKPIHYHLRIFFETLGMALFFTVLLIIPALLVLTLIFKIGSLACIPFYLISLFFGIVIGFLFDFIFGMLAFYIKNLWGIGFGKSALVRLMSGALIPLVFFPESIQKVFDFLPFKSMVFTPVMIFLGKYTGEEILIAYGKQLFWILLLIVCNYLIWKKAVTRLTVQGG
ncbi:ABC transporter permease [Acidaminobacter sp. JC074]|uniref:ABC transporter permease n=1 Tax=Acidaminobacter sp. JC074 TaxID=2530199 RepID=UPI001F10E2EB|nr:ABC-2 family transporter protein [Acidaminobacter sp. JC074]MCH4888212.1 ABC transporter permease [Acidaminobacter sp. JC074]